MDSQQPWEADVSTCPELDLPLEAKSEEHPANLPQLTEQVEGLAGHLSPRGPSWQEEVLPPPVSRHVGGER